MLELKTVITCPECGAKSEEIMPELSCVIYHECKSCGAILKPHEGDCCVYCSYATVPCPSKQTAWENGELGLCCSDD